MSKKKSFANIPILSVIILIPLYAIIHVICTRIIQVHGSASHFICICLDYFIFKVILFVFT